MEALLEKEGTVESWNDERLDELSGRMDTGFETIRDEMREGFARIDQKFELVAKNEDLQFLSSRFDRLQNTLLIIGGGLLGTVIASAAGVVVAVT
ncbi:MAG TPA: hypothetical protein VFN85_00100 [Solirubrobacterales bacterium]|nr:hypothetical protein [Solirubrobacterales bacterium]